MVWCADLPCHFKALPFKSDQAQGVQQFCAQIGMVHMSTDGSMEG